MEKDKVLEKIKAKMGEVSKPLENLASLDLGILMGHIEAKKNAYEGEHLIKKLRLSLLWQ